MANTSQDHEKKVTLATFQVVFSISRLQRAYKDFPPKVHYTHIFFSPVRKGKSVWAKLDWKHGSTSNSRRDFNQDSYCYS